MDYSILNGIKSPGDVKKLGFQELLTLTDEIRSFLIENVSQTGGHLASNLGIVELTVAIHRVFDTSKDRLVLDVGHQCYVHKLLTGRRDGFLKLRKYGGMSGFLRPSESVHDACVSGHASNSVSVALGMARARSLLNLDYSVIAVLGDGALTGGLAYEALNDAGHSMQPLIVVLNDNGMSIAKNVGAITDYLSRLRLKPKYLNLKDRYRSVMRHIPGGTALDKVFHAVKDSFKNIFIPASLFEDMGFTYLGPADGHDLKYVIYLLELARDLKRPVLIHLCTKKGKGYRYSEESPQSYHGVTGFDIESGKQIDNGDGSSFSKAFGDELVGISRENGKVCAITAAMPSGVGLTGFSKEFPDRFFDVGIAEGHAVSMAAGLANRGMLPVCAVYSTFLQRSYDMLIHDIAIPGLHVVFAVDRAGLVGEDGETHHGVFDIAYLGHIPNFRILAPSSYLELREMLRYAMHELDCPVAVRYSRGSEGAYKGNSFVNRESSALLKHGMDITLISYGIMINEVIEAAELSGKDGISCEIIKLNSLNPLDISQIRDSVRKTRRLIVVEDCVKAGSIGEKISARLFEDGIACKVKLLNTGDGFTPGGEQPRLYSLLGIDSYGIYGSIAKELKD